MTRETLAKVDRAVASALRRASIFCMVSLIFFVSAGVFVRFVPIASMGWADEIVEFGFAWMIFLGAASLWKDRTHFRVDLIPRLLASSKVGRKLEIILGLLALAFFLVFTYQGGVVSLKATDRSPILELPRFLWYGVLPISGGIIICYTLRDLWLFIRGR